MNASIIVLAAIIFLVLGYLLYGRWLAKQWGVDPKRPTPAHTRTDGVDYVPAKAPVLLGHHFSSIAGAAPISGPIQAAVFGWVPVFLWVIIGGVFFGAMHDFGALFASIRHGGQSIGTVINENIGPLAKKLFLIFSYLTLILVIATFASIVCGTFQATYTAAGAVDTAASAVNGSAAMISVLFILISVVFGVCVYRRNAPLWISTLAGVAAIAAIIAVGLRFPLYLPGDTWMIIVGVYIAVASVTPVWILLQPRDYLSSFLLYAMMAAAIFGVFGSRPVLEIPAFTGFTDPISSLGTLFPALFITIACGAISGFHSLVGSGTTAKQLDKESDARPIAYGGMLIECGLAILALCAVGSVWSEFAGRSLTNPTAVFATGISRMLAAIPGLANIESVAYALVILAVSAFCLTSLDTATRLARYMFQEFWLPAGQTWQQARGCRRVLANPYFATILTVIAGIWLGLTGYDKIWPMFGAANQLLAALALLAVAAWLGNIGRNNKMFYIPMAFMLLATVSSLAVTCVNKWRLIFNGAADSAAWLQGVLAVVLIALAVTLAVQGARALTQGKKAA